MEGEEEEKKKDKTFRTVPSAEKKEIKTRSPPCVYYPSHLAISTLLLDCSRLRGSVGSHQVLRFPPVAPKKKQASSRQQ